jgi:L-aminopeptidase/D-esterase-like protein
VNAVGDLPSDDPSELRTLELPKPFENTTIGVVVTDAALTKGECLVAAQSGHDGMARALRPAHTRGDGDAVVVASTGAVPLGVGDAEVVRTMAAVAVEQAIHQALTRR